MSTDFEETEAEKQPDGDRGGSEGGHAQSRTIDPIQAAFRVTTACETCRKTRPAEVS